MTKYRVDVSVGIYPVADNPNDVNYSNSLFHSQKFFIEGERFGDVAPTIDGIYAAIQDVVEANGG